MEDAKQFRVPSFFPDIIKKGAGGVGGVGGMGGGAGRRSGRRPKRSEAATPPWYRRNRRPGPGRSCAQKAFPCLVPLALRNGKRFGGIARRWRGGWVFRFCDPRSPWFRVGW